METSYAEWVTINQSFWSEADSDTRFESGDQTIWNDLYANLPATRRMNQLSFNRIKRLVSTAGGYQRRNKKIYYSYFGVEKRGYRNSRSIVR